jgi:acyl-coenzyme A synthetase/AMP-(fatty) acid ligase
VVGDALEGDGASVVLDDLPTEDRLTLFEALLPEQGAAVLSELKGETLLCYVVLAPDAHPTAELANTLRTMVAAALGKDLVAQ